MKNADTTPIQSYMIVFNEGTPVILCMKAMANRSLVLLWLIFHVSRYTLLIDNHRCGSFTMSYESTVAVDLNCRFTLKNVPTTVTCFLLGSSSQPKHGRMKGTCPTVNALCAEAHR